MITIGRNPKSTIVISEQYDIVSNNHAEISQEDREVIFTDHSSNGTIINGQKIQGKSVNIYPGDKILLAGICELSWSQISEHIMPVSRPTVARNIRGGDYGGEQRTQPMGYAEHYSQQQSSVRSSRPTDLKNDRYSQSSYQPTQQISPQPYERQLTGGNRDMSSQVERELNQWNWGAFFFGWIWGVFNKVYISLVQLVVTILGNGLTLLGYGVIAPLFYAISLGIGIWLGVKGSRMAWDNDAFRNLEHFRTSRHNWNVAALIVFCISVLFLFISLLLFVDVITKTF